jgi:flagellar hook-associated protein FlgK
MVNLVKFEAAYNAAAKMVSMADEMLDSLMNIVR